jgi:ABC-2 type transport system ATP-binding protein
MPTYGREDPDLISFSAVTKRYGRKGTPDALSGVSLAIPAGSVWAVVGPNGAGKSTLLSLLLGFIRPTSGRIELDGEAPRDYLRACGAGYLPERFLLPAAWRVRDALRLCARLDGVPSGAGATAAVVESAAAHWGLDAHLEHRTTDLSRGLLQRLGLAQALLAGRSLVVLDEPTEGLDPVWRIRLRDVVAGLRDDGRTVILASHDLAEVERVADRAVLLERGAIRDIMDARSDTAAATFDITLERPFDRMAAAFPSAELLQPHRVRVQVSGAVELSERLAALLGMGGIVSSVQPVRQPLEDRVRAALERDG